MREEDEGDVGVTLALDAVYFHQAKQMVPAAEAADKEFTKWARILSDANEAVDAMQGDRGREDEMHDLCVTIDRLAIGQSGSDRPHPRGCGHPHALRGVVRGSHQHARGANAEWQDLGRVRQARDHWQVAFLPLSGL